MRYFLRCFITIALCITHASYITHAIADDPIEHYNVDRNYHYLSLDELQRMLEAERRFNQPNNEAAAQRAREMAESAYCRTPTVKAFARRLLARPTLRSLCLTF